MKSRYALDASTALDWSDEKDRVLISQNLRANAEVLAGEILLAESPAERRAKLTDLQRVYTRLAVCDMDAARKVERRLDAERKRDSVCRITLEKMADMVDDSVAQTDDDEMARAHVSMAKRFAALIQNEGLEDWFSTGPYSGLGRLSATICEMTVDGGMKLRAGLMEVCDMARRIPLDQGVDEERIEAQVFRDGLNLLRRHLGLDKQSRGM